MSRACAVYGGTYVLGPPAVAESIEANPSGVTLKLPCHPRPITASHLIVSPDHLPPSLRSPADDDARSTTAHCIAVVSSVPQALKRVTAEGDASAAESESSDEADDTGVSIFPPEQGGNPVRALVMGEGTGSCPSGQCESPPLCCRNPSQ